MFRNFIMRIIWKTREFFARLKKGTRWLEFIFITGKLIIRDFREFILELKKSESFFWQTWWRMQKIFRLRKSENYEEFVFRQNKNKKWLGTYFTTKKGERNYMTVKTVNLIFLCVGKFWHLRKNRVKWRMWGKPAHPQLYFLWSISFSERVQSR